jgi:hypothetical protein
MKSKIEKYHALNADHDWYWRNKTISPLVTKVLGFHAIWGSEISHNHFRTLRNVDTFLTKDLKCLTR